MAVILLLTFLLLLPAAAQSSPRERQSLDTNWRFQLSDPPDVTTHVTEYPEVPDLPKEWPALAKLQSKQFIGTNVESYLETIRIDPVATRAGENVSFVQTGFKDGAWRQLDLPHDWAVELPFDATADRSHGYKALGTGFPANNIGWYRRTFVLPAADAGKTLRLEFDGVYRNCLVWFNGHVLGRNVSGYSGFAFDVTKFANPGGTNVLVVRVDASRFEGWFYEGAGIYRHVWLVKTSPVHVGHWGTFVSSTVTNGNATLRVETDLHNDTTSPATCVLVSTIMGPNGNAATSATDNVTIPARTNRVVRQTISLVNPGLWSLESPNLYKLVSKVTQSGATQDVYETPFGVRTVHFDPDQGFFLNGRRVPIQGTCNHQDHAGVGAAMPDRLQYFRLEQLKEMGCNVYRASHNPPTPELLDACDRLGMLVLDESRRFGTNAEPMGQLRRLILRDRNHPSIFAWCLANEEWHFQGNRHGPPLLKPMVDLAHSLDPTRPCTVGMDGGWGTGFTPVLDVQGFNYLNRGKMDTYHHANPRQPAFGTEEASAFSARGIYENTPVYNAAYDTNKPGYGSTAREWVQYYAARPWASGACVWTGFDYRGEPSPFDWPNISSHFGILDTCGFPKDTFYYYQANWSGKTVLHLFPHWNWTGREGQPINVWCFSNCEKVELFLNGKSQGERTIDVRDRAEWHVPYAAGTLHAVGYRNGRPATTNTVTTTGPAARVRLQPDRGTITADGQDISLVAVSVVDAQGRVVPTAGNTVSFSINGGVILGVGNGDPASHEMDKSTNNAWQRSVFNGLAQIIVQSPRRPGPITLAATAPGLTATSVVITAALKLPPPARPTALRAVAENEAVRLSWNGAPGALGYRVKRSTTTGGPYAVIVKDTPNSFYTDSALANGGTHHYVVSAVNNEGESADSTPANATPALPVPPPAPTGPSAAPLGSGRVKLTWKAAPGATRYQIKVGTRNGGPYLPAASVSDTSYVSGGLTDGTTYHFVVSAANAGGESADTAAVSAAPAVLAPLVWYRANAITGLTHNAKVPVWTDGSGHANHATNAIRAERPAYVTNAINGLPAVRFEDNAGTWLAFNRPVQDDFTILCVFKSLQGSGSGTLFWEGAGLISGEVEGSADDFGVSLNENGQVLAGAGNLTSPDTTAATGGNFNTGKPHVFTFTRVKKTGALTVHMDGALAATATGTVHSLTAPSRLVLGAQQTLENFFTGDIAEVKIFGTALSDPDRAAEEQALAAKYHLRVTAGPAAPSAVTLLSPTNTAALMQ